MLKLFSRSVAATLAAGTMYLASPAVAAPAPASVAAAVEKVLVDSAAAYSKGDFEGFIASYEVSPDTTFVSEGKVITGYEAIAASYRAQFGAEAKAPGKLSLKLENVRELGAGYVLAIGRFKVDMPDATSATGIFSLTFHKTAAGWRIVADHTS